MSKKTFLILGLIGLPTAGLMVVRMITPPGVITSFPTHFRLALEAQWDEWRSPHPFNPVPDVGEMRHVTIWNQQEGYHLVRFTSRGGGGDAILREEQGEVEVLAIRGYEIARTQGPGALPGSGSPQSWRWHVPHLSIMVTGFEMRKTFHRVEAIWLVDDQTKRVEYDVPGGATRSMVFVRYEGRPPGRATIFAYDRHGNLVGNTSGGW